MKLKITFLLFLLFASALSYSQKNIEASNIMKDLKAGKMVSYKNATIIGVLDFTYMEEALEKLPRKKKNSWWNMGDSDNTIKKLIEEKISFINCTFKDDVLAYIPDENSGYTFIASFEDEVIFKNCNFKSKAMFKYSRFESNTDFTGTNFEDDSTFKWAKFDKEISFSKTRFTEISTFKYATFKKYVSFTDAVFEDSAVFKYTKFNDGVSFENTNFEEDLNIKYMEVSGNFNLTGMKVGYDIDSKYTKINGRSFNTYLLKDFD
ncbi:MAG: hypothetical protein ACJA1B_001226 [Polaribacter sp.]|jgi:hypothetical protein